jgi:hypothetical protein
MHIPVHLAERQRSSTLRCSNNSTGVINWSQLAPTPPDKVLAVFEAAVARCAG